ncbi:MAG: hypothetical protein LLG09_05465 [Negativicutes bacterium]|nr:hypothetical protein [Negativicutes bacterium]
MEEKVLKPAGINMLQILVILVITILAIYTFVIVMTDGAETKQIFMSTEGVADMEKLSEAELILEYKTDDFYAYFTKNQSDVSVYAMVPKLIFWVYHYPSSKNPQGLTARNGTLYYYGTVEQKNGAGVTLQTPEGRQLTAVKQVTTAAGVNNIVSFIFAIENYAGQIGDYQLLVFDAEGSCLTVQEESLNQAKFQLTQSIAGVTDIAKQRYFAASGENADKWPEVLAAFTAAITNLKQTEIVRLDESKAKTTTQTATAELNLGRHLTIYTAKQYQIWEHTISWKIMLDGSYAGTVIYQENDYRDVGTYTNQSKGEIVRYYSSADLQAVTALFRMFTE